LTETEPEINEGDRPGADRVLHDAVKTNLATRPGQMEVAQIVAGSIEARPGQREKPES
jgi:hypothetical protein